ncbi:MAG TPA: adenylyltransferase/cytidyltransferase family protein [Nitrososphaerales archaeon]|nr:adenylyltransferase/cytidyltransferase family protein [Nitrososphaerales archaeon]
MDEKRILGAVFSLSISGRPPTIPELSGRLGTGAADTRKIVSACKSRGLLSLVGGRVTLTVEGRRRIKVVFIGGGFEVIHRGHLHTISRAKCLGDVLVAVLARDSTIRTRKRREPVADENQRLLLLSSLRQVDAAILGVEGNIYDTLERVRPDVVALGYDQHHLESDIEREGKARGIRLKVVRLDSPDPRIKTTALLRDL